MSQSLPEIPRLEEMKKNRLLFEKITAGPGALPVTFAYGGNKIKGIPDGWELTARKRRMDSDVTETVFEGTDPETRLEIRVECLEYLDFPVVEWVAWFSNRGGKPTPLIRDICSSDILFGCESPVLYHSSGDFCSKDGYIPGTTPLKPGASVRFAPRCGRACDDVLPYFRILFDGGGKTVAVGWPGQWYAEFRRIDKGVEFVSGQEKTCLSLMPGETVRTPGITVMSWDCGQERAVNMWRRFYLAHILPKPGGRAVRPMLTCSGTAEGEEYTQATEENQLAFMKKYYDLGIKFDVWWLDAGWYPCEDENGQRHWGIIGTWEPDPKNFPNGFGRMSDYLNENGSKLLLWFEPERVVKGSQLEKTHPEWIFKIKDGDAEHPVTNYLLNLGNDDCRSWVTRHISKLIRENGIKIYRQDFNIDPLRYWRENEPENRQGINENLHVQGYLRFWDDLLEQNPGLLIDSCASGGRRNDLETMRRSVPLHYSDYGYGDHPVKLAFHRTMYEWLPYFKDVTKSYDLLKPGESMRYDKKIDRFGFHCGMAPMLFLSADIKRDDYDYDLAKKLIGIWRRASAPLLYGDYYQLTSFGNTPDRWVSWQFDLPEAGSGFIQGIRLPECPDETLTVYPCSVMPDREYAFENPETGERLSMPGDEIMKEGFTFRLDAREGAIWFYRRSGGQ